MRHLLVAAAVSIASSSLAAQQLPRAIYTDPPLDIAQAVRRDGWNAITVNYRGSWGSPGEFRFGNCLEDADAVLAFLRDPGNARSLGLDTTRLVIAGHRPGT